MEIPGVPALTWLTETGRGTYEAGALVMDAPARTDWFNDPAGTTRFRSAPALVFRPDGNFVLSARITADLVSDFDAGVLFVHGGPDDYAKFCFERSPKGTNTIVSVVTKDSSDDSNGAEVAGNSIRYRIARVGKAYAFHASVDGSAWDLIRLFRLRDSTDRTSVGFMAQAPTGSGCTVEFSELHFERTTLTQFRDGS